MLCFAVAKCEVKACLNWRIGNKCILDQMIIITINRVYLSIQPVEICEAHRQFNVAKLQNLLEE